MEKRFIGVDFAAKPKKWWQRLLVWLGFRDRWADKTCMVLWTKKDDGTVVVEGVEYP